MAAPRVFISSTAYDFKAAREQLYSFVRSLGFEAVANERSDILFDFRSHTHNDCVREVASCDVMVVLVGSRFGSEADLEHITSLDIGEVISKAIDDPDASVPDKISVTQAEVLSGIQRGIPIFTLVDETVLQDKRTYEANIGSEFVDKMQFASITQVGTARYIFSFIDLLQNRSTNNAVIPFGSVEDITNHLRKQWAALFQRLLDEQRESETEQQRLDVLGEKFDGLKEALLTTIADTGHRAVARSVIEHRQLLQFVGELVKGQARSAVESGESWADLFARVALGWPGCVWRKASGEKLQITKWNTFLLLSRGDGYETRLHPERLVSMSTEWERFRELNVSVRLAVWDAISDDAAGKASMTMVRPLNDPIETVGAIPAFSYEK